MRDHFSFHLIVSAAVYESFIDTRSVKHDGDNLSDHDPIVMSMNIYWNFIVRPPQHNANKYIIPSEQNLQMYEQLLTAYLSVVKLPIYANTCHDVACNNKTHFFTSNDYSNALIIACLEEASHAIPRKSRFHGDLAWLERIRNAPQRLNLFCGCDTTCGLAAVALTTVL